MTTTPTGAFLPPLSNRSSPVSSRRNSADDKPRKSNSRSASGEGSALSARRMHVTTAGQQLQAKKAEEERKEREMEAATHSSHFPSPPPNKLTATTTASRIAVPLPRDLLPSKRASQPRRPPLAAASLGSTATFALGTTWGQRDRQDNSLSYVDGAMARATFQDLLRDTEADSRRTQDEEKQTSSLPFPRSHNSYAPPPSRSAFLPSTAAVPSSPAPFTTSDSGLMSALTQRVHTLETLTQQQSRQLAAKEQELIQMQVERDTRLAASNSSSAPSAVAPAAVTTSELQLLRGEYERLVRQVSEMEQFLGDYGLQWIGDSHTTAADSGDTRTHGSASASSLSSVSSSSTLPFHLPTLLQRVEQLNASLPPTSLLISHHSSVTRFQPPPYLLLTLYRDGLTLTQSNHREQPLRSYDSSQCQSLLGDMLDGFFPSEWRSEWPEGVRIVVADRSGEKREEVARRRRQERRQRSWHAFEGAGRRVRETVEWREQVQADEEAERAKREEQKERQQRAKEAFLSRLPTKTVSEAGQVVEVKAMVQRIVDGDSRDAHTSIWKRVPLKDSDTLELLRSKGTQLQGPFDPSLGVCTVHVHVQHSSASDGVVLADSSSFLLLLQSHHTMSSVLALLQRHVLSSSAELRDRKWRLHWASLQPRVVVEIEELTGGAASTQVSYGRVDDKSTVAAVGWRHNCSLFLHVRSL